MSKEIKKEQDASEIISTGEKFFEKHANLLIYIVLAIVVIAFGIWAYIQYVHKPREEKAAEAIFVAENNFINNGDSTVLKTGGLTDQGVLAEIKEYSGTKAAKLAHLYAGIAYYDLGNYDKAIEELKAYSGSDNMIAPSAVRLLGDCYVQQKKYDEAINCFEKAAKMANNEAVSPGCLLKAAHVYEFQKKYSEALKLYKEIKDKYYRSPESTTIESDILRVEGYIASSTKK